MYDRDVDPPWWVNLRALLRRLTTICFTFWRSLCTSGAPGSSFGVTTSFERAMTGSSSAMTFGTISLALNSLI